MTSNELRRRSLMGHESERAARNWAKKLGNVAFVRDGRFLTCTRSYVCDCINAEQILDVLCDHDAD